jgi:tetratricopeptide (TPR) repeat protein
LKEVGAPALTEAGRSSRSLPPEARSAPARRTARLAPFAPAAILVVLWSLGISASGAYFPGSWYPGAAFATLLLIVAAAASGRPFPTSRPARVALGAFAALVALNYLSILWAGSPADALAAANELLLYLAVAWTFSIMPWTPRALALVLAAFSLGIAAFCAVGLAQATATTNLTRFFVDLRYSVPLDYPNATSALAVMGMWPALILSARRELPGWTRAVLLAVAVFLTDFAFLPQSRGALAGIVLVVPLVLALASDRVRLLVRMGVVGASVAVTLPGTVNVDNAVTAGRDASPVLAHAATAMLETAAAALVAGMLLVLAEARLGPGGESLMSRWRGSRRTRTAFAIVAALAVVGAGIAVAPRVGRLARSELRSGRTGAPTGSNRLFSGTPEERFDYARVAVRLFASAPVAGVGAGNFGRRYDALRRFPQHSLYAHNLPLRVASETGTVGLVLLVAIIVALLVGLARAGAELGGLGRACAVAGLAIAAYFLVHDSLDWLDEFPVLAAPALALPLAAIEMRRPRADGERTWLGAAVSARLVARWPMLARRRGRAARGVGAGRVRRAGLGAVIVVVIAGACLALGAPYLAILDTNRALANYTADPAGAYRDLARAASLNPLSADPLVDEGAVAVDLGNPARARSAFARALGRENAWYPHLELALLDAQVGQFTSATEQLSSAASLDVDDPAIAQARTLIAAHRRVSPATFNRTLLQGAAAAIFQRENVR